MSRSQLPLNALRAFEAAARHLSFTRAAEELNVTPGAISQQIRQLEEFAGAPLFRRTGRQVLLTDAGQAALPLLTSAFEMMAEAVHHMRAPARRDRLMISSAPSFAAKWLAPRLEKFQELNPEAEVWVSADIAMTDFNSSDIDLAIRHGKGIYEGLRSDKIMSESVLPVCSPDLMAGPHPLRSPADLSFHVLLHDESPENDPSRPDWNAWLKARGVTTVDGNRGPRFTQSSLVVEAAAAGRADLVVLLLDGLDRLAPGDFPFLQVDLAVAVGIKAAQQFGSVLFPIGQQRADIRTRDQSRVC